MRTSGWISWAILIFSLLSTACGGICVWVLGRETPNSRLVKSVESLESNSRTQAQLIEHLGSEVKDLKAKLNARDKFIKRLLPESVQTGL